MILKLIWIILGTVSLALGVIGIVVPGLPTTPFLLLTAILYLNGSSRLHNWLLNHKVFGHYLRNWKKGINPRSVATTLVLMWAMVIASVCWTIDRRSVQITVLLAAVVGTFVQFYLLYKYHLKKNT
ncbi:MAG: YbaN family protein [Breznakibacter sp.]